MRLLLNLKELFLKQLKFCPFIIKLLLDLYFGSICFLFQVSFCGLTMRCVLLFGILFALTFFAEGSLYSDEVNIEDNANGFTSFTIKPGDNVAAKEKDKGPVSTDKKPSNHQTGQTHEPQTSLGKLSGEMFWFICFEIIT